ncbi:MAG: AAA family ATPase [Candidatus Moranbacteria bacterium]|nr:AAA family ATPase [Candidatus Moranbacteria bacterium]
MPYFFSFLLMENNQKIVIGITGKNGSGKDTVSDYIVEKYQARKLVYSDLLKKALRVFLHDIGRDDFSWLATNLRKRYGEGIIGKGMEKAIEKTKKEVVVLSGLRDFGELELIRNYDNGYLIYIEAPVKLRWRRIYKRRSKADDEVSFAEFLKVKENLPTEKKIAALKKEADYIIVNDKDLDHLQTKVESILNKIIKNSNKKQ